MTGQIYLDNAATTFPKPKSVIEAVTECLSEYCANPGRSTHKMALYSAEKVYSARECVANFLGAPELSERVVFTANATHALNIAIKGTVHHKCHIITSDLEHNSVIRPLERLKKDLGVEFSVYNTDIPIEEAIEPLIRDDTKLMVTTLASNVTGKSPDIRALSKIAKKHSIKLIADASQLLGHQEINLRDTPIDIICAPAHKGLLGIQGGGFMTVAEGIEMTTLLEGGSGGDTLNPEMPAYFPERFEAGTQNLPSIVALAAGIEHLGKLSMQYVEERTAALTKKIWDILCSFPSVKVYGCENGIASFEVLGKSAGEVGSLLDDANIAVRAGLHCAPYVHKKLRTENRGLVRVSTSVFTSDNDLEVLYRALKRI